MRILVLTWEFPPFITGGLGMACYGLVKALLQQGTEVDLFLPTREDVYFPLRKATDVDTLPVHYFDEEKKIEFEKRSFSTTEERLEAIGLTAFPESYSTPGFLAENIYEWMEYSQTENITKSVYQIKNFLRGDESLFKKVREFTSRISRHANKLNFDLIHANDWLTYPAGMLAKKTTGRPLIAHIHATEFDRAGGPGDNRIHHIEYLGLSTADRVFAVSQYTANMIFDRYRINPKKTSVIHNAYSVSDGEIKRTKLFKDPLVLFLGRVTLQKGPDYFIQVAERVIKEYKNVRFVMAGTGDMLSELLKRSAEKRLKDRILFSGFLNREQVEHMLSATDIFVMPSVSEPFGIVPLEAMALGSAAIISKQSGVAEVIENAYKVDFWDIDKTTATILELLKNPKKRSKLAEAGRQEVLAIGWKKAAEKTNDLYKETLCSI